MEKEQLYDSIEAFLDGELQGEALATFEQELATDAVLAREVALHRRLELQLADRQKINLRATLEALAKEFPDPGPDNDPSPGSQTPKVSPDPSGGGVPFWWWGLGFALIVGIALWWYLSSVSADNTTGSTTQVETIQEPSTTESPTTQTPDETSTEAPESTPENTATEPPGNTGRPQAFNTNAQLETLLGKLASSDYTFAEEQLKYEVQGQRSYLNFSAKLTTGRSLEQGLYLQLYSNLYPKGRVLREAIVFKEANPDAPIAFGAKKEYFAAYSGETKLDPALYYGVITTGDDATPLWVGKFRVE